VRKTRDQEIAQSKSLGDTKAYRKVKIVLGENEESQKEGKTARFVGGCEGTGEGNRPHLEKMALITPKKKRE